MPATPLVVEDGTGLSDARSYITLVEADQYHLDNGNAAWAAATDDARNAALVKSGRYLNRFRWKGVRIRAEQALAWPRYNVCDPDGYPVASDSVPQQVKDAQAEAALRSLSGDLAPDLDHGGQVQSESVKVGPIEESTTYVSGAPARTTYTAVTDLIAPYVVGTTGGLALKRA